MSSTEVQNPQYKLDNKCLCLSCVFGSVLACAKSAHMSQKLSYSLCGLCLTLPQTLRLFYVSLRFQAPQQQYIVHCMRYGITLWVYLSEPFIKDSHKHLSSTESHNTACSSHLITHYRYVRVTEKYTETFHVKKMADLVTVTQVYNASNF